MMAKMFYTLDETKAALGRDDDAIKRLTGEGRLREFRDGPRLMYKADQVENLKTELENGDEILLGPSDTGAPIGLVDSRSGSSPVVSLSDSNTGSGESSKEDTAMAADLGLSHSIGLSNSIGLAGDSAPGRAPPTPPKSGSVAGGSVAGGSLGGSMSGIGMAGGSLAGSLGGIPSPIRPSGGSGLSGLSGSAGGSRGGIDILDDNDGSDPSAQTAITPGHSGSGVELGAEAMGSGSGLLDLTRESDNTSLGAVLDEIPGGSMAGGSMAGSLAGGSLAGSFAGGTLSGGSLGGGTRTAETMGATISSSGPGMPAVGSRVITPPTYVEARDPMAPAFAGAALGATAFALLAMIALASGVLNTRNGLLEAIAERSLSTFPILAGIGAGLAVLGFVIGLVLGKARA